jgi:hypothetical protein
MLKQNGVEFKTINDNIPLNLSSILLVEADQELRGSRRLLLGVLEHPVLAVSGYAEVCALPPDNNCCLVAIDISPSEHEANRIAGHVRRIWPKAKILLLGTPSGAFDDPLYDDVIDPSYNPSGVVNSAKHLLRNDYPLLWKNRKPLKAIHPG